MREPGSGGIHRLFLEGEEVVTSRVAYAETYAALTRRRQGGDLTEVDYSRLCREFEREWPGYVAVQLTNDVLRLARDLIKKYALRGFDGIHLASAAALKQRLKTQIPFACADERLCRCAEQEGFRLLAFLS